MNGWVSKEKVFYIYRHIRKDKNEPFYIGKGVGYVPNKEDRFVPYYTFYKRAHDKNKRSAVWRNITAKTNYEVEIIFETKNKNEIDYKEKEFIKLYGKKMDNTGILCNLTDGGDGISEHGEAFYRSVEIRKEKGVYKSIGDVNSRPVYVYSLDGFFIKKIRSKKDISKIFGGDKSVVFDSIKKKRSYCGYFLSNTYFKDGINHNDYRFGNSKGMSILQINKIGEVINVFNSKTEAAKYIGAKTVASIDISNRKRTMNFGYYWRVVPNIKIYNNGNYNL